MSAPIAVSCGEPAGIGPEIAAKAWDLLRGDVPMLWIGDPAHLPDGTPFQEVAAPAEAIEAAADALPVWPLPMVTPRVPGQADPRHAPHVIEAIRLGSEMAMDGRCAALCTAPIHKQALIDGAGFGYPGHTEYLAHLGGDVPVVMMLACDALRVVPATIHTALRNVPDMITRPLLEQVLRVTHDGLWRDFGIAAPRIAVSGLNPHAGEGGKMGHEEAEVIAPVIEALRADGLAVSGPHPADAMFHDAARARYDAAVCMYHDQALIPIKTVDFAGGVNVTLGLPFIRTSPDHGTAFDIAGTGVADPSSMVAALRMAHDMARRRDI
ncbi:MAG: 4-hydroxythreonine-4-phosphate dehydrogenase PdxA [Proteobacteria bacterium]|nr:MAG: 4-hydroxythreonine-4-phosphate dehydrogenase PdxA [Pseudomonadota bacterium]